MTLPLFSHDRTVFITSSASRYPPSPRAAVLTALHHQRALGFRDDTARTAVLRRRSDRDRAFILTVRERQLPFRAADNARGVIRRAYVAVVLTADESRRRRGIADQSRGIILVGHCDVGMVLDVDTDAPRALARQSADHVVRSGDRALDIQVLYHAAQLVKNRSFCRDRMTVAIQHAEELRLIRGRKRDILAQIIFSVRLHFQEFFL